MKKLIISGGSGFLGSLITDYFGDKFEEIVLLSRKRTPPKISVEPLFGMQKRFLAGRKNLKMQMSLLIWLVDR